MQALGEDIVLLAITRNGKIAGYEKLRFALAGSQLVRLAAAGRIQIDRDGYVRVLNASPTGDATADLALSALEDAVGSPRAREWVARQPAALVTKFLNSLAEAGVIQAEDRRVLLLFRTHRWVVLDKARRDDAKKRLDAIARSRRSITAEAAAFAGLVYAAGLAGSLYPAGKDLAARDRLAAIARQDEAVTLISAERPASSNAAADGEQLFTYFPYAAIQGVTIAAIRCSVDAAHHAAAVQHHQSGYDGGFHHDGGGMVGGGHHG